MVSTQSTPNASAPSCLTPTILQQRAHKSPIPEHPDSLPEQSADPDPDPSDSHESAASNDANDANCDLAVLLKSLVKKMTTPEQKGSSKAKIREPDQFDRSDPKNLWGFLT